MRQNAIANAGTAIATTSGPEKLTAATTTTSSPRSRLGGRPRTAGADVDMTVGSQVVSHHPTSVADLPLVPTEIAAGDLQLRVWDLSLLPAVLEAAADPAISTWNPVRFADPDTGAELQGEELARAWIGQRSDWERPRHLGRLRLHVRRGARLRVAAPPRAPPPVRRGRLLGPAGRPQPRRGAPLGAGSHPASPSRPSGSTASSSSTPSTTRRRAAWRPAPASPLEGVARQAYRYGDGVLHDDHMHARLASDPPPPDPR